MPLTKTPMNDTRASWARSADSRLFGGNREIAIQRDGEKCVRCGMTRSEHRKRFNRDITVDHIDGKGLGVPREEKNNDLSNLQTLCTPCHSAKDNRFKRLTDVQVVNIMHMRNERNQRQISELYGTSQAYISLLLTGRWRSGITGVIAREKNRSTCDICEKSYIYPPRLTKHINNKHAMKEQS